MIKFSKIQAIALWFHIPMWIVTGFVIVIIGAYNAGKEKHQVAESRTSALMLTLPVMTLHQISEIRVSDI